MAVGALLALSPAYPVLFASGAVWIESLTRRGNLRRFALASLTVLAAGGAALGLIALPILHVKADLEVGRRGSRVHATEYQEPRGAGRRHPPHPGGW